MKTPMTESNLLAWQGMVDSGMKKDVAFDRLADWARMLERRVAELDPHYQAYPWGRMPSPGTVISVARPPRYEVSSANLVEGEVVGRE